MENLIDFAHSHFSEIKRSGNSYLCRCPAHEDKNPSLSIGLSDDGKRILLHCFAGCSTDAVLAAAGLQPSDLYLNRTHDHSSATEYIYQDEDGSTLYTKHRTDYRNGTKSFCFFKPDGTKGIKEVKRVPYNLPAVLQSETVYFVEGEKCADAIIKGGYCATTLDSGSNSKWPTGAEQFFEGKKVVVLPDNDEPGIKYAMMVTSHLPQAVIKLLPGLSQKGDIFDWLAAGHTLEEVKNLPNTAKSNLYSLLKDSEDGEDENADNSAEGKPKKSQSAKLLELFHASEATLFHDDLNDLYAAIPADEHIEIFRLDSRDFSLWLQKLFYRATGGSIRSEGLSQVVSALSAIARFGDNEGHTLFNRVGEQDNAIWYDLTDKNWQAVKVTAEGWGIENSPILFTRYRHQTPQVQPQRGGDIQKIFRFVNIKHYSLLFLCWLVSCFIPGIPHPMPVFYGEKGSAKSTSSAILKRLIDPSALDTPTLSNDQRTLVVNLQQHWFLPFDNLFALNGETSDMLCRAITGGSVQQRKLFTDGEDYIFCFMRCIALNGVSNVVNRSDLLDRSLLLELERVPEEERRELREVYASFEEDRPLILGAIFDTLSAAMRLYPSVKLDKLPRMADFCRWGYAIAEAMEVGQGERFLQEYKQNCAIQNMEAINADAVAVLIVNFMRSQKEWTGLVSELLNKLVDLAPECGISRYSKSLPTTPNTFSRRLNQIKSNLKAVGITFDSKDVTAGKRITLYNENISPLSSCHVNPMQVLGSTNGDTSKISPPDFPLPPILSGGNGDDGDNYDDYADVEF